MGKMYAADMYVTLIIHYLHWDGLIVVSFTSMNSSEVIQGSWSCIFQTTANTEHTNYTFLRNKCFYIILGKWIKIGTFLWRFWGPLRDVWESRCICRVRGRRFQSGCECWPGSRPCFGAGLRSCFQLSSVFSWLSVNFPHISPWIDLQKYVILLLY